MSKNNKISTLVLLLLVIIAVLIALYSYKDDINLNLDMNNRSISTTYNYVELNSNVSKSSSRVLVSDRFTGNLKEGANVLVVGDDGSIYSIANGVVLVDGVLVDAKDNSYEILRVNSPQNSVKTE